MSVEENKAVIRKIFNGLSKGNLAIMDECMTDNFVRHSVGMHDMGKEGYKQLCVGMGMSPGGDFRSTIDEIVAEGDKVAFRCTHQSKHTTPIFGVPPTGKQITVTEVYFSRLENGKVAEWWCMLDMLGFQQQLGISPPGQ